MTEKKKTRFSGIINRAAHPAESPVEPEIETTPPPALQPVPSAPQTPKMGRPGGKKTNPEYTQVTVYLRKDVHRQAKKILIDDGREFSELVDELVSGWIRTSGSPTV
jgi:hypothetical protein